MSKIEDNKIILEGDDSAILFDSGLGLNPKLVIPRVDDNKELDVNSSILYTIATYMVLQSQEFKILLHEKITKIHEEGNKVLNEREKIFT